MNPAAWLHMMDDSLADLSHLRKFSWEMGLDSGGFEAIPACRAILRYVLLIREELVFQDLTVLLGSFLASECKPYHLFWDLAGRTN